MAITISFTLQKGGVGKSTTAETVAAILGSRGKKVLLVDMDSQSNVTFVSGAEVVKTISDVITGEADLKDAIYHCNRYDLLAADGYLANFEVIEEVEPTLLKNVLAAVQDDYDFIMIDTPPALGNLLKNSLVASDYVIIPIDARPFSVNGLDDLEPTLNAVKAVSNRFKILGVVLVKYSDRTVLNRQIKGLLTERVKSMNTVLFDAKIRESVVVAEAQAMQTSLIDYAPKSKVCMDYQLLTDEILQMVRE